MPCLGLSSAKFTKVSKYEGKDIACAQVAHCGLGTCSSLHPLFSSIICLLGSLGSAGSYYQGLTSQCH